MNITPETPRKARNIGNKEISFQVQVPEPFVAGPVELTEGEANALNQTLAENLSNNLRKNLVEGQRDADGNITEPHTAETAQAAVDEYLTDYQIGVRKAGSASPRVSDPVEREARKLARKASTDYVKSQGLKTKDVDMATVTEQIFETNRDTFMTEAAKVLKASAKATEGLNMGDIDLTASAAE